MPNSKAALTGINHITIVVSDLARSRTFYSGLLGAVPRHDWEQGSYLEIGDLWLCLELGTPAPKAEDHSHIAFSCTDFDAMAARLVPVVELWKENVSEGKSLYFIDPDGHKLEVHDGTLATRLAHYQAQSGGSSRKTGSD